MVDPVPRSYFPSSHTWSAPVLRLDTDDESVLWNAEFGWLLPVPIVSAKTVTIHIHGHLVVSSSRHDVAIALDCKESKTELGL